MDPHTLIAAALVCAAWYPRAMRNLYHTIKIGSRTSYNLLFKQCHASPRVKQWLASTCELTVDEPWDPYRDVHMNNLKAQEKALPSALAGLMPRVRILHISSEGLRFIRTDFFLALSSCGGLCLPSPSSQISRCNLFGSLNMLPVMREPHCFDHHLTCVFDALPSAWMINTW
ncbi:uncharacterized protein B0H18DRAFT_1020072 [Fomitopsis serialis]|uniref:uncharacterized protein n=1 Tax=Fomitopsis serialis TaxID=139415 RepID=UPI002007B9D2|nr:uncharacterized protein B0H18DRAFT_1020072 [Neoantrodia serialis]KAH9921776.1 hypothetical protein B0H18DRAFT_1020072 [Neoantrodia serialis]